MDHIAVCVCTFKRPAMLKRLVDSLQKQKSQGLFTFSISVVDNDGLASGRDIVASLQKESSIQIRYDIEPEQNISLARNRALAGTEADYYACLDDDEFADEFWLFHLYRAIKAYPCDGVLGPVRASDETPLPAWLRKGKILDRKEFATGTSLVDPKHTRTGNVLFSKKIIRGRQVLFKPEFGRTGGEDCDFFGRMIDLGHRFVWCNEALVYETTPPSRLKRAYYLRRALLRGVVQSKHARLLSPDSLKSLAAIVIYSVLLPLVFIFRNRRFMPILIKDCDHLGKFLARCGIPVVKHRAD